VGKGELKTVMTIELTQGYVTYVDNDDQPWLAQFKWNYADGYAKRMTRNAAGVRRSISMHLMLAERWCWTARQAIDHVTGNTLDNRRCNLRPATFSENQWNSRMPKNNTSGHKGVSWNGKWIKWRAYVYVGNRQIHLGCFDDIDDAVQAATIGRAAHHGCFGRIT
jgi:hypothetical protein